MLAPASLRRAGRARSWPGLVPTAMLVALTLGAWVSLVVWDASAYGRYLDHDVLAGADAALPAVMVVFAAGWTLMLAAMMFPTVQPLVVTFAGVVRQRSDRRSLVTALVAGYLIVWTGFGFLAFAADGLVHLVEDSTSLLHGREWMVAASVLAAAGVYQFLPIKYRCLDQCRSPQMFVMSRWRGRNAVSEALTIGAAHGAYCVGCCAPLMVLMFAVGMGSFGLMLALAAVMTVEKVAPGGHLVAVPLGVGLVLGSVALTVANLFT